MRGLQQPKIRLPVPAHHWPATSDWEAFDGENLANVQSTMCFMSFTVLCEADAIATSENTAGSHLQLTESLSRQPSPAYRI